MAAKRRRRRRRGITDYRIYDPKDGLNVHRIVTGGSGLATRRKLKITQYEYDNVYIESADGRLVKEVSIMHCVRKINRYKSTVINSYKEKLNRKA